MRDGIMAWVPRRQDGSAVARAAARRLPQRGDGAQRHHSAARRRWRRRAETVMRRRRQDGATAMRRRRQDGATASGAASLQRLSGGAAASPPQRGAARRVGSGADGAEHGALGSPPVLGGGETRERACVCVVPGATWCDACEIQSREMRSREIESPAGIHRQCKVTQTADPSHWREPRQYIASGCEAGIRAQGHTI